MSSAMLADGAQALLEVTADEGAALYLAWDLSLEDQLGLLELADEMLQALPCVDLDLWEDHDRDRLRTWLSLAWATELEESREP